MSFPCEQEQSIKHITSTLDRLERGFEKLVELLQTNAQREAEVKSLQEEAAKTYKSLDDLYVRVRLLETAVKEAEPTVKLEILQSVNTLNSRFDALDKQLSTFYTIFKLTTSKYALAFYLILLIIISIGFFNDIKYHSDIMNNVWSFFIRRTF